MTLPFFHDHGYSNEQIALIVKIIGLTAVDARCLHCRRCWWRRWGLLRSLVLGSILMMISSSGFAVLATTHTATLVGLGIANGLDNLAHRHPGHRIIAYPLEPHQPEVHRDPVRALSSLFALAGKTVEGFSGFVSHATGYPLFFVYTASLSLPGLLLLSWLWRSTGGAGLPTLALPRMPAGMRRPVAS